MKARMTQAPSPAVPRRKTQARAYLNTPGGWLFILIAILLLVVVAVGDRTMLLDQDNYLEYFSQTTWDWFVNLYQTRTSTLSFVISTVTEEFGWRTWLIVLNAFGVTPDIGVRVTVVLANALVIAALLEVRRPLLGLLLWAVVPVALATVGLFQIRQGLAFGIAMLITLRYQRPVLGWVLASFVHTTFAIPALLLLSIRACGDRKWRALIVSSLTAFVLAAAAGYLFNNFGGRRVEEYADYQDDFTIRLLILLIVYATASVIVLYTQWKEKGTAKDKVWTELCTMHVALMAYLVFAYVLFPFGKGRVWYCIALLLPYVISQIRFRNAFVIWWTALILLTLSADALKNSQADVYSYFLH
ncbi:EpsG family protein [Caballeronia sp. HLA56]